jgi:hypothetical protein
MSLADAAGLLGVLLVLIAYGGAALGRLEATGPLALVLNLIGASLILVSLIYDFNLSAFVMESLWALIALIGLGRLALRRKA